LVPRDHPVRRSRAELGDDAGVNIPLRRRGLAMGRGSGT
jgi:hypothetical protein